MLRVLLAEDDDAVRSMLEAALERDGFEVVAVANVRDALRYIATEKFDALLSDLHMPRAGDGFTVISAMRHTHPQAVTVMLSGYPAIDEALSAIRCQADEVLMKTLLSASCLILSVWTGSWRNNQAQQGFTSHPSFAKRSRMTL
jgi:DNA-binding NtrC family response regulator